MTKKPTSKLVPQVRNQLMRWVKHSRSALLANVPIAMSDWPNSWKLGFALISMSVVLLNIAAGITLWLVAVKLKA